MYYANNCSITSMLLRNINPKTCNDTLKCNIFYLENCHQSGVKYRNLNSYLLLFVCLFHGV